MSDVLPRLQNLFRDVLDDRTLVLTPESNAQSIRGYDSLVHINIISAVEQEFEVRFELEDILSLENAGDLIALVRRKRMVAA
jgi:acyl carrier protein